MGKLECSGKFPGPGMVKSVRSMAGRRVTVGEVRDSRFATDASGYHAAPLGKNENLPDTKPGN